MCYENNCHIFWVNLFLLDLIFIHIISKPFWGEIHWIVNQFLIQSEILLKCKNIEWNPGTDSSFVKLAYCNLLQMLPILQTWCRRNQTYLKVHKHVHLCSIGQNTINISKNILKLRDNSISFITRSMPTIFNPSVDWMKILTKIYIHFNILIDFSSFRFNWIGFSFLKRKNFYFIKKQIQRKNYSIRGKALERVWQPKGRHKINIKILYIKTNIKKISSFSTNRNLFPRVVILQFTEYQCEWKYTLFFTHPSFAIK